MVKRKINHLYELIGEGENMFPVAKKVAEDDVKPTSPC